MPPPRTSFGKRGLSTYTRFFKYFCKENRGSSFRLAFTLAEVLITLGIIGIVAALTLPSLIQNHRRLEASSRLKKFTSSISQALLFAERNNGTSAYEWTNIDNFIDEEGNLDPQNLHDESYAYWNKYLNPYMNTIRVEKGFYDASDDTKSKSTKIYFADSSTVELRFGNCIDLWFDTNGDRKPNIIGRDRYMFFIATEKSHMSGREHELYHNHPFGAAYMPLYNTKEKALDACKRDARYCSALLQYDNYEFKDDYPYRL